ncbi:hypothetical protein ACP4OV_017067 [Aristida adscensionis]
MAEGGACGTVPAAEGRDEEVEEYWHCPGLEPLFYDEAATVADHERRRRKEEEEARENEELELRVRIHKATKKRITSYDPKQGGEYVTRFSFYHLGFFDLDEESPLGPMRYTDTIYQTTDKVRLETAINILSVKMVSLDVHFLVQVYVIARDNIDYKCVYLFRQHREHAQLINSMSQSLILTSPKRGLMLLDDAYVEIDLMIKGHQQQDREPLLISHQD